MPKPPAERHRLILPRGPEKLTHPLFIEGLVYASGKTAYLSKPGKGKALFPLGEIIAEGNVTRLEEFKRRQRANPEELSIGRYYGNRLEGIAVTLSAIGRQKTEIHHPEFGDASLLFLIKMKDPPVPPQMFTKLAQSEPAKEVAEKADVRTEPAILMSGIRESFDILKKLTGDGRRTVGPDYGGLAISAAKVYGGIAFWVELDSSNGRIPTVGREELEFLKLAEMKLRGAVIFEAVDLFYRNSIPSGTKLLTRISQNFKILWETKNLAVAEKAAREIEAAFRDINKNFRPPDKIDGLAAEPGRIMETVMNRLGNPPAV